MFFLTCCSGVNSGMSVRRRWFSARPAPHRPAPRPSPPPRREYQPGRAYSTCEGGESQHLVAAFKSLVMPLLPRDVRVDVSSQRVVVWRSFMDEVGVTQVEPVRRSLLPEPGLSATPSRSPDPVATPA